jgi:hypothetical protein
MRPTTLEAFDPGPREPWSPEVAATPAPRGDVPLARRVGAILVPDVGRTQIEQRCGPWQPALPPPASFRQALCVARAAAGLDEGGGAGLDQGPWRRTVQDLGLDPAALPVRPVGDPMVSRAALGDPRGPGAPGAAVIVDSRTGEPYVVIELEPIAR